MTRSRSAGSRTESLAAPRLPGPTDGCDASPMLRILPLAALHVGVMVVPAALAVINHL